MPLTGPVNASLNIDDRAAATGTGVGRRPTPLNSHSGVSCPGQNIEDGGDNANHESPPEGSPKGFHAEMGSQQVADEIKDERVDDQDKEAKGKN